MFYFIKKYKQLIINALILITLFTAFIAPNGNLKDGMLGFAFGATLITFGESIGNLKKEKIEKKLNEEKISEINS